METNSSEKPTTSRAAKDGEEPAVATPTSINTTITNTPPPSQTRSLSKTVSSPTALSLNIHQPSTPTLGSIGKQGSVNFRHSWLYDSGAEGSDVDDQTRLIRTPSIRSHKFIIIPATSPALGKQAKFPSATSTSSLTALQKLPLHSPTNLSLAAPPTPTQTWAARTQQHPLLAKSPVSPLPRSDVIYHPYGSTAAETSVRTGPGYSTSGSVIPNPSVKFTIEDYESDNATDAYNRTVMGTGMGAATATATSAASSSTLDALYSFQVPAISSIYSGINSTHPLTGATNVQQPSSLSSSLSPLTSQFQYQHQHQSPAAAATASASTPSPPPFTTQAVRPVSGLYNSISPPPIGTGGGAASPSTLGIGLRPRNDRNSSMRSVVSGESSIC